MQVYDVSESFPKSERYGAVSQLKRASVSIMLNHVEGFARFKPKVKLNFFQIAYGSAKECKYLIYLAHCRKWIASGTYQELSDKLEQINKMLWSVIKGMK